MRFVPFSQDIITVEGPWGATNRSRAAKIGNFISIQSINQSKNF